MKNVSRALVTTLFLAFALSTNAATLQLDFTYDFSDPNDPDSAPPDTLSPAMTATFDDGGSAGSVSLTIELFANEVSEIYFNVDDLIGSENLTITADNISAVSGASIFNTTDGYKADADGLYDIYIDLPPPGGDRFTAGEIITFNITGAGIEAGDFNFLSTPTIDPNGPFLAAAKFQTTGDGLQSAWVAAVPIPAAVWLFGSALAGLGLTRRFKKS